VANEQTVSILVATPSVGFMKGKYTMSLIRMYDWFMTTPQLPGYPKETLRSMGYQVIEGSVIPQSREEFCRSLVKNKDFTHILFIDEDMGFTPEAFGSLLYRKLPMVGCNYRMKVPPCNFTARKIDNSDWIKTDKDSTGVEPSLFMGFGLHLIERRVVEAIQEPRFLGAFDPKSGKYSTEDGPFMVKAQREGFIPHVDHDASKLVYHCGNWTFSWDDDFPVEKRYPYAERINAQ
jgi:hypothetical protein